MSGSNGHASTTRGKPVPLDDLEAARCVLRVARTRESPPRDVAGRLPHEWGEACLLAGEDGPAGLDAWQRVTAVRLRADPARYAAIEQALADARDEGPDLEPDDDSPGPKSFASNVIGSAAFASRTYQRRWLIERIAVLGQPGIVGGPRKAMKTSLMVGA